MTARRGGSSAFSAGAGLCCQLARELQGVPATPKCGELQPGPGDGVLSIQGEKKVEVTEGEAEKKHCVECAYGSFLRTFVLPSNADAEKVDASFKYGVLELSITKTAESKAKKIEVKGE